MLNSVDRQGFCNMVTNMYYKMSLKIPMAMLLDH